MCGIVGYVGEKDAQDFLLQGLKRLEYRGYDSAGIVTLDQQNHPTLLRSVGKIINLEAKIKEHRTKDHIGIGHTRWATHGNPSEKNAHPHRVGSIFLVHNGIIENYKILKEQLNQYDFQSDTDTEVLAALIDSFYQNGKLTLEDAVTQALKLVKGTYGIAVLSVKDSAHLVVARSGSPLVIGVGKNETLIASDASALVGYTKKAIYLNDGEIALISKDNIEVKTLDLQPVSAQVEEILTDLSAIQKGGYNHFLLKEIMEQPDSLKETLRGRINHQTHTVHLGGPNLTVKELKSIRHLIMVGCGTAYYAAKTATYLLEQFLPDVTIEPVIASEYRYRHAYIPDRSVALIVSQSGETADTLACLREIKAQGTKTIGIVNAIGSTIAREVDGGTYVHAGPEISVASTKAFTSQVAALLMFGLTIAEAKGVNSQLLAPVIDELAMLPDEISRILKEASYEMEKLAKKYYKYDHAIYLGRDVNFPIALEGALKLKEISYIDANAYPTGELKHGPIALIDDRFFEVIMLQSGFLYEKSVSGIQEVLARGGHVAVFTDTDVDLPVESIIKIKTDFKVLTPILFNLLSQLFAYYIAVDKGNNVDQPRNLAKSVTVE